MVTTGLFFITGVKRNHDLVRPLELGRVSENNQHNEVTGEAIENIERE